MLTTHSEELPARGPAKQKATGSGGRGGEACLPPGRGGGGRGDR